MLKQQIEKYARFNVWANNRMIGFLLASGSEALDKEQQSSFSTLRKTAYHIYDAECAWQKRMTAEPWTWPPSAPLAGKPFEEFINEWKKVSADLQRYVESLPEAGLNSICEYKNIKGESFKSTFADCIMHCINHSTYHRGQMITMLRASGFTNVASTDYIAFTREN